MSIALVHIGTHKTGTKSFQRWATVNRHRLLREHGIHVFPGFFTESNLSLPLLCTRPDRTTPALAANPVAHLPECRAELQSHVAEQVGHGAEVLLASAEDLCLLRYEDEVERLVQVLAPREVHVAVCLRDPAEYLRAYRSQMARLGQAESAYPSAHPYYGADTWLTRWDEMLVTWRSVVGPDRVLSFGYEDAMANYGSTIPAVLEAFRLEVADLPTWRGYRENVTAAEEHRDLHGESRYRKVRAVVAATRPGRAIRRAIQRR